MPRNRKKKLEMRQLHAAELSRQNFEKWTKIKRYWTIILMMVALVPTIVFLILKPIPSPIFSHPKQLLILSSLIFMPMLVLLLGLHLVLSNIQPTVFKFERTTEILPVLSYINLFSAIVIMVLVFIDDVTSN